MKIQKQNTFLLPPSEWEGNRRGYHFTKRSRLLQKSHTAHVHARTQVNGVELVATLKRTFLSTVKSGPLKMFAVGSGSPNQISLRAPKRLEPVLYNVFPIMFCSCCGEKEIMQHAKSEVTKSEAKLQASKAVLGFTSSWKDNEPVQCSAQPFPLFRKLFETRIDHFSNSRRETFG